jgi:putative transposase
MVKPAAYRRAVGFLMAEFKLSARRACRVLGVSRSTWQYKPRRVIPEGLVEKLRGLAQQRPRFGYRQLGRLLRRAGFLVNHERVHRLYREEGLAVRRKKRKRLASANRVVLPAATRPNQRWAMDFVSDVTWQGRRFRIFTVIDAVAREALALLVYTSIGGARVAPLLEELAYTRGCPESITRDNGPEFTGKALDAWA